MVEYRDCNNHLACVGEPATGKVQWQCKDRTVSMTLPIGESITFTRKDTVATLTRVSHDSLVMKSTALTA